MKTEDLRQTTTKSHETKGKDEGFPYQSRVWAYEALGGHVECPELETGLAVGTLAQAFISSS